MGLRYSDRYPAERELDCYGRDQYFDPGSYDCQRCDYFRSCGEKVREKRRGTSIPVQRSEPRMEHSRRRYDNIERPREIPEGRSPAKHLFCMIATGACREAGREIEDFFSWWRF